MSQFSTYGKAIASLIFFSLILFTLVLTDLQRKVVVSQKEDEEMRRKYKAEIVALDSLEQEQAIVIYFADDFTIEGAFIRFVPKHCFTKLKSYDIKGVKEIVLPSRLVLEAIRRE